MNSIPYSPIIDTITPSQVTAFLKRKGWRIVNYKNPSLIVLEGHSPVLDDEVSIVIPADHKFADFPAKLRDCISLLSEYYNQSLNILVHQIAHWDRDVLAIKIENPLDKEQLLPVDSASKVISRYRDFIAFAASTETEPKRFFAKLTAAGKEFAVKCMFGHTFVGSFGLTIECPLELAPDLPMFNAPQVRPFARAVTERIATGYSNLNDAVLKDDPEIIVNNHRIGFSGNMCDILTDIYDTLEGRNFSHSMIWTPELKPPQHLLQQEAPVRLNNRSYEILKAASKTLQTVEKPNEDKTIIGRITRLHSEQPPLNIQEYATSARTIIILWEFEKGQPLKIHITLTLEQYLQACDAHKNGRKVKVLGKPTKIGKFWNLLEHHDFEII